jgi:nitrile hydratase
MTDHNHHNDQSSTDPEPRVRALQSLLIEKGLVSTDAIDKIIRAYEQDIGPMNGATLVARAWEDPEFRTLLLEDPHAAIDEADIEFDVGEQHLQVVENTPSVHNIVVCTLCSCYPWSMLGLPPTWYKSDAYRSRVVREPRTVLAEFGLELDPSVNIRVWDSSSEIRYMVLPQRPPGIEGYSRKELTDLVTRNAMIGVERSDADDTEASE